MNKADKINKQLEDHFNGMLRIDKIFRDHETKMDQLYKKENWQKQKPKTWWQRLTTLKGEQ